MGQDTHRNRSVSRRLFVKALALAGAVALTGCSPQTAGTGGDDPSGLVALDASRENGYLGRWISKSVDGESCKVTTAPGAFLEFDVAGATSASVRIDSLMKDTPFYWAWQIDGGDPVREQTGTREIRLPDKDGHLVRITADGIWETTNRWGGEVGFALRGIDPGAGTCTPHPLEGKVIAYYGDSITEGDCVFGANSAPLRCSAVHGYATLSARILGCLPYCSGYGGTGILEKGTFAPAYEAVTHYSRGRLAPEFEADAVVVEYGTNDKRGSAEAFLRGYERLLEKLSELHPEAPLLCMVPLSQIRADEIRTCAAMAGAHVVETAAWNVPLVADGTHPSVEGAQRMAARLAAELGPFLDQAVAD